ncbi:MAG: hypothetical protein IPL61_16760 [Myxococcales bacterium]|nr:hypothetical protein [Myxococcales bacterium]
MRGLTACVVVLLGCGSSSPPAPVAYVSGRIQVDGRGRMKISLRPEDRHRVSMVASGTFQGTIADRATGAVICRGEGQFDKKSEVNSEWIDAHCQRPPGVASVRVTLAITVGGLVRDTSYDLKATSVFEEPDPPAATVATDAGVAVEPSAAAPVDGDPVAREVATLTALLAAMPPADSVSQPCPPLPDDRAALTIDHALMTLLAGGQVAGGESAWLSFGISSAPYVYLGSLRLHFATRTQPDTAAAQAGLAQPHRLLWVVRAATRRRATMVASDREGTFNPGLFSGTVVLLDRDTAKALCWAPVHATSSQRWEYDRKKTDAQTQLDADLSARVLAATTRAKHLLAPALVDEPPAWLDSPN